MYHLKNLDARQKINFDKLQTLTEVILSVTENICFNEFAVVMSMAIDIWCCEHNADYAKLLAGIEELIAIRIKESEK